MPVLSQSLKKTDLQEAQSTLLNLLNDQQVLTFTDPAPNDVTPVTGEGFIHVSDFNGNLSTALTAMYSSSGVPSNMDHDYPYTLLDNGLSRILDIELSSNKTDPPSLNASDNLMTIYKFYNFHFECKMTVKDANNLSAGILLDIRKSTTDTLALKVLDIQPDLSVVLRDVSDTATGQLPVGEYNITSKACGSRVVVTVVDSVAGTEQTTELFLENRRSAYLGFVNNSSVRYSELKLTENLELPTTGVVLFKNSLIPKGNLWLSQPQDPAEEDRLGNYRLPNRNYTSHTIPWDYETVDVNKWYLMNETFINQSETDSTRILYKQAFRMLRSNGDVIQIIATFNRDDYYLETERVLQRVLGEQTYNGLLAAATAAAAAEDPPRSLTQEEKYAIADQAGLASGMPANTNDESYPRWWANPNYNPASSTAFARALAEFKLFSDFIFDDTINTPDSYVQYLVDRGRSTPSPGPMDSFVPFLNQYNLTTLSTLASDGILAAFIVFLLTNKLAVQAFPIPGTHPTPVIFGLTPADVVNTINSIMTVGNHDSRLTSSLITLETAYAALPP